MRISRDSQVAFKTLQDAQKIALLVGPRASVDAIAAAMAVYHLLLGMGKKVAIIVPGPISKEARDLPASAKIQRDFGPRNLVITLDTNEAPIDRVSYKSEEQKFELIIHPRDRNFSVENIHYRYSGLSFDLLVLFGVSSLEDLGELYTENRADFAGCTLINIDVSSTNTLYGQLNLVDPSRSSLVELVFNLLMQWDRVPSRNVSKSLLIGFAADVDLSSPAKVEVPRSLEKTK